MSREFYLSPPPAVEVHPVLSGTDIILRKNIAETVQELMEEGGEATAVYACDEAQYRHKGNLTAGEVADSFDFWWEIASGSDDVEASDTVAAKAGQPTSMERLEALESALLELVEVVMGG